MQSYRPRYHASVPSGWSNDPNGTVFYNGKAHLFYQHFPHKPEWGTMHWGHFTTKDFIKWENEPVALVPDKDYEIICGCCSGSAIEKDGNLWLMYTAAQPERQRQCIAISTDGGVTFAKSADNPILTSEMLSPEVTETDCRDPRIFVKDGMYYFIGGARVLTKEELDAVSKGMTKPVKNRKGEIVIPARLSGLDFWDPEFISGMGYADLRSPSAGALQGDDVIEKDGFGNLILARSKDLLHWEYVGHLLEEDTEGQIPMEHEYFCLDGVYECPDYMKLDGVDVVLTSPQNLPQMGDAYQNVHSGVYMMGELNFDNGRFRVDKIGELDHGFDFYAAQTFRMPDGRVVMTAWKEMWDRNFPTRKEGWAGTYILPRELRIEDGEFIQRPVREIENYRGNKVTSGPVTISDGEFSVKGVRGTCAELSVTLELGTAKKAGIKLFCGEEHETLVYYDKEAGKIIFDRSKSGIPFSGSEENVDQRVCAVGKKDSIDLHVFLDINSIEVFIDGGRYVMTGNVYPDLGKDDGICFFAEGGSCTFKDLVKYDIEA